MASGKVKEQLQVALDESTSEQELRKIWRLSRSVNVRKAVASNPNAGPTVLREAARLYLEEVLENPGFSMLELFHDDQWISRVSMAYNDPWNFLIKECSSAYYIRSNSFDHFGWAALLSPQLNASALDRVTTFMSTAGFRRAIKSQKTMEKVKSLYVAAEESTRAWPFSLETMLLFYKEQVINPEQLLEGLSNFGPGSVSTRKSVFTKFIKDLHSEYIVAKSQGDIDMVAKTLAKCLLIARPHVMHWLWNCFSFKDLESWAGELYSRAMRYMISYSGSRTALIQDNIRAVGSVVTQHIKDVIITDSPSTESITKAYQFISSHQLKDQKFSRYGLIINKGDGLCALKECDMEVKEFFCKAGCVGNWASTTGSDVKYKIINEVNEHIYAREGVGHGNLLFDKCSVRKVVSLDEGTFVV